jgi:hypothetical protein
MPYLLSDRDGEELPAIFESVRNIQNTTRGRPIRRDRGGQGGSASRAYVVITSVTNESYYIGNVIGGPDDPTVSTADVSIRVKGATYNAFEVGFVSFSDVVDGIYYIEGFLLG